MAGIFVSYRRKGARRTTYHLVSHLQREFHDDQIFVDVESIDPGVPFSDAISSAIAKCSVVLVVIGPSWVTLENEEGQRRLDNPDDWIRREIEIALSSKATIIQVLVEGAEAPEADELPESIRRLAGLNAFELADNKVHWDFDVSRLIEKICRIDPKLRRPKPKSDSKMRWVYWGLGMFVLAALLSQFDPKPDPKSLQIIPTPIEPAQKDRPPSSTPLSSPPPSVPPPLKPFSDLSGTWYDNEGVRYQLTQRGNNIFGTVIGPFGEILGQAQGTIVGRNITFGYTYANGEQGEGQGVLQADNIHIDTESRDYITRAFETNRFHKDHWH